MPRLIVNTSNLKSGGALQVASTFIEGLRSFSQNQYFVFLPLVLYKSIERHNFPNNFTFYLVDNPSIIPFFKKETSLSNNSPVPEPLIEEIEKKSPNPNLKKLFYAQ